MARRSDHTREELRELMISSARDIIAEKGLIGLTAREVAGKIGYSAGTIYNVFSNLDEIVFQLEHEVLDSLEMILCSISEDSTPEDQLQEFVSQYLEFIETEFNFWELLVEHRAPHDADLPDWYMEKFERIIALVEQRLKPILSMKEDAAVARAARVLWAGLHGIILLSGTDKLAITGANSRKEYAEFWVRVYIEGLKVVNSRPCQTKQPSVALNKAVGELQS